MWFYKGHWGVIETHPGVNVSGPTLVFDWKDTLSSLFTALHFFTVNSGAADVDATPEISPDGLHACTVGLSVPEKLTIPANEAGADPYGIDLSAPYWRLWMNSPGTTVDVYVIGISRRDMDFDPLTGKIA